MNAVKSTSRLVALGVRELHVSKSLADSTKEWEANALKKLHATQARFQAHNDLPIHLKGGAGDTVMYRITFGVCGVGMALMGKLFYELAYPAAN